MGAKKRAVVISVLEWAFFTLGLILLCGLAVQRSVDFRETFTPSTSTFDKFFKTLVIYVTGFLIISLLLNILLTVGVAMKDNFACKLWSTLMILITIAHVVDLFWTIVQNDFHTSYLLIKCAIISYRILCVHTIMSFTESLAHGGRTNGIVYSINSDYIAPRFLEKHRPNHNLRVSGENDV